jgi:hypothetical protein
MDSMTGQLSYTVHTGCGVCIVDGYGQLDRPTWLHGPYGLWGVQSHLFNERLPSIGVKAAGT